MKILKHTCVFIVTFLASCSSTDNDGLKDNSNPSIEIPSSSKEVPSYVATDGLVGWWPFNNNANDTSGNSNNGTVSGTTITADRFGNLNSAYSFNGINSYINMPSGNQTSINVTSDFTLGFWFKTSQTGSGLIGFGDNTNGNGGYLVAIGNGNLLNGTNKLSVFTGNTWYGGNVVLTDNHWHYACVTLKGNNLKIIIDNILDISIDNVKAPNSFNGLRAFGARNNGSGGFFNGIVDDIGLWNRALTQTEITNLYKAVPSYVSTEGLVGWWPFNNNANDASANANNGSVVGATITADRFGNFNSAYSFNGVDNKIEVLDKASLKFQSNNKISVSLWFKMKSLSGNNGTLFFSKQSGVGATQKGINIGLVNGSHDLAGIICNGSGGTQNYLATPSLVYTNDSWHHYVYTFDNGLSKTYIDNVLINSSNIIGSIIGDNIENLLFGTGNSGNVYYFKGILDDIGVWNRVLTQTEIADLYNAKR